MSIAPERSFFGLILRPVSAADTSSVLRLRLTERARGNLGLTSSNPQDQETWVKQQQARDSDYYWVIGNKHHRVLGTIGIYDTRRDADDNLHAEWGRWVVQEKSHCALGAFVAMLKIGFEELKYKSLISATVATNQRALAFHRRFGTPEIGVTYRRVAQKNPTKMIEHRFAEEDWNRKRFQWEEAANTLASKASNFRIDHLDSSVADRSQQCSPFL